MAALLTGREGGCGPEVNRYSSQVIYIVCLDAPAKAQLRNVKKSPVLQVRYPCIGYPREDKHSALDGFAKPGWPWHDFEMDDYRRTNGS